MTRSPFTCRTCGYIFGQRHHSGRLHVGPLSALSFEPTGRNGPFARLVCPICGSSRVYVGGPLTVHASDIVHVAEVAPDQ